MELAAEEYRRLVELLSGLDERMWRTPTDCPGWDVFAMVSHLCGAADGNARMRETVRQAWVGRRRHRRAMLVDSMNEVQIEDRAAHNTSDLVAELADAGRRGVAARSRLPRPLRALVLPMGAPVGTKPLGYLMDCIYTRDAWMHRIDICRAVGRPLIVTADHDGMLVADLVNEWADAHGQPYQLTLTGPAGLESERGNGGQTIAMNAIEFARTVAGRVAGDGVLDVRVPF